MIGYSHCFRLLRPMAFSTMDSPSADAAELKRVNTLINATSALEAAGALRFDCKLVPAGTARASVVPPVQPPSDRVCHLRGWLHVTVRKPAPAAASQGQSGTADPWARLKPLLDWLYLHRSGEQAADEDASRTFRAMAEDRSAHKRMLAAMADEMAETERLRRSLKEAQDEGRRMKAELEDLRARHARVRTTLLPTCTPPALLQNWSRVWRQSGAQQ